MKNLWNSLPKKLQNALKRAGWTFMQVLAGGIPVGAGVESVDWWHILSIALVAAIVSFLKSNILGTPEDQSDGEIIYEGPESNMRVSYNVSPENYEYQKKVVLDVVRKP